MLTIYDITEWALEELKDWLKSNSNANENEVYDRIFEIADSSVPHLTREILEIALSDFQLACTESEIWPAYWKATPINHIISNIYEYIKDELYQRYYKQEQN